MSEGGDRGSRRPSPRREGKKGRKENPDRPLNRRKGVEEWEQKWRVRFRGLLATLSSFSSAITLCPSGPQPIHLAPVGLRNFATFNLANAKQLTRSTIEGGLTTRLRNSAHRIKITILCSLEMNLNLGVWINYQLYLNIMYESKDHTHTAGGYQWTSVVVVRAARKWETMFSKKKKKSIREEGDNENSTSLERIDRRENLRNYFSKLYSSQSKFFLLKSLLTKKVITGYSVFWITGNVTKEILEVQVELHPDEWSLYDDSVNRAYTVCTNSTIW